MRVACCGWYGHGNFGDELILEGLRQLFKNAEVIPFSSDGLGCYPKLDFRQVNRCDLFVLGGGELINSQFLWMPFPTGLKPRTMIYRLYTHSPLARRSWIKNIEIPKVVLGCGVDVESTGVIRANVIRDLEMFSYIGLRDNVAVKILQSIPQLKAKTELFHDLVFAVDASREQLEFLARVFRFKLHGFILSYMANVPYCFKPYHRKVRRVQETVEGWSLDEIRRDQHDKICWLMRDFGLE